MRVVNVRGRACLEISGGAVDLHDASAGQLPSDPMELLARWPEALSMLGLGDHAPGRASGGGVSEGVDVALAAPMRYEPHDLLPPVPRPRQIFAIGLNFRDHAAEAGLEIPNAPVVFTKFSSCQAGPFAEVSLPHDQVDWEAELVVVIGRAAHEVPAHDARAHIAGFMVGQDLSDRAMQWTPPTPQFSLAKSHPRFGPTGDALVTLDELPIDLVVPIECRLNGEVVQSGSTGEMIFGIDELVARLSATVTLLPGDLIFTGTPAGVGSMSVPPRFLRPGDVLETTIGDVGTIRQTFR